MAPFNLNPMLIRRIPKISLKKPIRLTHIPSPGNFCKPCIVPKFSGTRKEKNRIVKSIITGVYELILKKDDTSGLTNNSRIKIIAPNRMSLEKIFFRKSVIFSNSSCALKLETYLVETSKIETAGTDAITIKDRSEFIAPKSAMLKCRLMKNWKR